MTTPRRLATALATGAIAAAALLGTTATGAGHAEAKVPAGSYNLVTSVWGIPNGSAPATVRGHTITVRTVAGPRTARIHSTRTGGYFDLEQQRYVLHKRGNTYTGATHLGPVPWGRATLRHR